MQCNAESQLTPLCTRMHHARRRRRQNVSIARLKLSFDEVPQPLALPVHDGALNLRDANDRRRIRALYQLGYLVQFVYQDFLI